MKFDVRINQCNIEKMEFAEDWAPEGADPSVEGVFFIEVAASIGIETLMQDGNIVIQTTEFSLDGPIWNVNTNSDGISSIIQNSTGLYWSSTSENPGEQVLLKPASNDTTIIQKFSIIPSKYDYIYYVMDSNGLYASFSNVPPEKGDIMTFDNDPQKRAPIKLIPAR